MWPGHGRMVYWRFKGTPEYRFGFVSHQNGLCRMGRWNGDWTGGTLVDPYDIDWKPYG